MKKILFIALILSFVSGNQAFAQKDDAKKEDKTSTPEKEVVLLTDADRISYCLGINVAQNIKNNGLEHINTEIFIKAINDIFAGKTPVVDLEAANKFIFDYMINLNKQKLEEAKTISIKYLEDNRKKKEIQVLQNGIQYQTLKKGNGVVPRITDKVSIIYTETLTDGTVLNTNPLPGKPSVMPVNEGLKGRTQALLSMPVGSKWKIFIPYDLAYGEVGNERVKPFQNIIITIELIAISN